MMEQKDKDLLLKDLCARFPFGVKTKANDITVVTINGIAKRQSLTGYFDYDIITDNGNFYLKEVKPYLRPMSSMTEEEIIEFNNIPSTKNYTIIENDLPWDVAHYKQIEWLNKNMFDFRGLIDKGLAIKVTEENNPYKD